MEKKLKIVDVAEGETDEQAVARHQGEPELKASDMRLGQYDAPLSYLRPSPNNPRKDFGQLGELVASLTEVGVLQPLLARPRDGYLEVVCGHRRLEAARLALLAEVPVDVREMTDEQAQVVALTENLQRKDLAPLEEAAGYEALMKRHGMTVEAIADRVKKSKRTIYNALELTKLGGPAKKLLEEGKLSASTALVAAMVRDPAQQEKAAEDIARGMTYREALEHVRREFLLNLDQARFLQTDAELVPKAGACTTCPKRTGAQPELFSDLASADICTDSVCFHGKEDAWWAQRQEAAKRGECKVVEDPAVFTSWGELNRDAPYVRADDKNYDDAKYRTFRELLGKAAKAHVAMARTPKGDFVELLPKAGLTALLKEVGKFEPKPSPSGAPAPDREARKKEKAKADLKKRAADLAMAKVVAYAESHPADAKYWRLLASALGEVDLGDVFQKRRGLEDNWREKWLPKLTEAQLRGVVLELSVQDSPKDVERACEFAKVDVKECEAEVKAADKEKVIAEKVKPKVKKGGKEVSP